MNKDKKLKGVLLDVDKKTIDEVEIRDDIDVFHELIGCRCIDIVTRRIGDTDFDIILDDEGLLKRDVIVSAISKQGINHEFFAGNLLIFKSNDEGELISLNDNDVSEIKRNVHYYIDNKQSARPYVHTW